LLEALLARFERTFLLSADLPTVRQLLRRGYTIGGLLHAWSHFYGEADADYRLTIQILHSFCTSCALLL